MYRILALVAAAVLVVSLAPLHAEDALLGHMYGKGVHAFFSQDYVAAHGELTAAIDGGTKDPRSYYFRGLSYLKLGRETEAEKDFAKGAELESLAVDRPYNISKSLQRIQGKVRVRLEQYRVRARMAARERAEQIRRARYEVLRQEESRVLAPQGDGDAEALANPNIEPADTDPFALDPGAAVPAASGTEEAPVEPTAPVIPPATEPTAIEPVAEPPVASPTEPDPFATTEPPTPVAPEPVAAKPDNAAGILGALGNAAKSAVTGVAEEGATEAPAESNPFEASPPVEPSVAEPATDNPFGEPAPAEPPAAEPATDNPFGQPATEPATDNPFGEPAPAEPPAAEPATDNPFGQPATEPATDNPFGEPAPVEPPAAEPATDNPFDSPASEEPAGDVSPFGDTGEDVEMPPSPFGD